MYCRKNYYSLLALLFLSTSAFGLELKDTNFEVTCSSLGNDPCFHVSASVEVSVFNNTGKNIKAWKADLVCLDIFDERILRTKIVSRNEGIDSGSTVQVKKYLNLFEKSAVTKNNTDLFKCSLASIDIVFGDPDNFRSPEDQAKRAKQQELDELQQQQDRAYRTRRDLEQRIAEQRRQDQEENEQRLAELRTRYISEISETISSNWSRPPTTQVGMSCSVKIFQIPGGEIISAEIISPCNADRSTRQSIEIAINRVNALPYKGYEDVFAREIEFNFMHNGSN